jgi:hypothetical protein
VLQSLSRNNVEFSRSKRLESYKTFADSTKLRNQSDQHQRKYSRQSSGNKVINKKNHHKYLAKTEIYDHSLLLIHHLPQTRLLVGLLSSSAIG